MMERSDSRKKESLIKRFLPHTLLGRSLLIILVPLVLLQVVSTWVFYDRHYNTITRRLAQGIAGDIAAVILILDRNPTPLERDQAFRLSEKAMWLNLAFEEGANLPDEAALDPSGFLDVRLAKALSERFSYPFYIDSDYPDERVLIQVQRHNGVLNVLVSAERLFSSTTYIFIMWMVGTSIILFAVAMIFMRNQIKPIRRLAEAAEGFGKGRDVASFKPEGATEVRQASAAFLRMRNRIKRQIQQRTEMLAGVSHDLRTPLTRMKLQLEMLQRSTEVESLQSDVIEMEQMVEGYLAFARGEGTEQRQNTDLGSLLGEVVTQMSRDGGLIDLHLEEALYLPLQREAMRRCLTNLIANAKRHGDHVMVKAGRRDTAIEVTIDDDGPGIPVEQRGEVFKPFIRLDLSRNPETGGSGLGLTIALDVVRNHGGELSLEDAPGGGLRARVILPI
ncbi:MAG: ATP-binding protein [Pseudomonadota bacterium]